MNRDILENSMGYNGFEYINDTAVHTPPSNMYFCSIQVVNDAVFTTLSGQNITGNTITGETIPAGTIIMGLFSNITLASGKVIAYKGV